jgi:glyoxylase-like metal-dependent hydrolase (beta-lactamase superfamily II)
MLERPPLEELSGLCKRLSAEERDDLLQRLYLPRSAGKKAQILVQKNEWDYANRIGTPRRPDEEPALEQFHSWMYVRKLFEVPGLNWRLIDGDHDLVGDDVKILSLPGHAPGFQGLRIKLPNTGVVFLSGCELEDMYYGTPLRGHGPGIPHAFTWSAAGELASLKKVRDLAASEHGQILCGHDAEQFKGLRHAPEYYDRSRHPAVRLSA